MDEPSLRGRESTTTTENEASGSFSLISSHASMRACSTTEDLRCQLWLLYPVPQQHALTWQK